MKKLKSKTIVVGEDDHAIMEVVKIILQDNGYEPIGVTEASAIIKTVEKNMPALILLDIWLSGEDGGDIAKELKRNKKTSSIPIVMVSANNETEHIARAAGAEGFLQKPFNMGDLIEIVEKYTK